MKVEGGLAVNDVIMGLQANYSNITINRKEITEFTALASVIEAGIGCGVWTKLSDIEGMICEKQTLIPKIKWAKLIWNGKKQNLDQWDGSKKINLFNSIICIFY